MNKKISAVVNTYNEEENIADLINSLDWTDEIVVVDDGSQDHTVEILNRFKKNSSKINIFHHKNMGFVEQARNFAISKASNDWILVLDADEKVQEVLKKRLQEIAQKFTEIDYVRIPRKNIIFGHWMQYCGWWPDYNIRFFKKGKVKWANKIHRPPQVQGQGIDLEADEKYAITHNSYKTISEFIVKMNKYSTIQAKELFMEGNKFEWKDIFKKPLDEFLSRFFVLQGYRDGLHGLALSFLQAFSFVAVYLKLWEMNKFRSQEITLEDVQNQKAESARAIDYWFNKSKHKGSFLGKLFKRK